MINYDTHEMIGASTEGFEAELQNDILIINGGSVTIYDDVYEFSPFGFKIESDNEFPVLYNVFLCHDKSIVVDRFIMLPQTIPVTSSKKDLLRKICTVEMIPNASAEESNITIMPIRNIGGANYGESSGDSRGRE